MAIDIKGSASGFRKESKVYILYFISALIIIVLYSYTVSKVYANITKILADTKSTATDVNSLRAKVDSLKTIKSESFTDVKALTVAFPEEDPSLFMYSQLKQIASNSNVILDNISFSKGQDVPDGVSKNELGFTLVGSESDVFGFITSITKSAPLTGLGEITLKEFSVDGGVISLDLFVELFYSALPKTLPEAGKIINALSPEEKNAYEFLTKLQVYGESVVEPSAPGSGDIDPFVLGAAEVPEEPIEE